MFRAAKKLFKLKYLLIAVAVLMLLSLSLHAVIPHDHPKEIFGNGIQVILHGNDRKWWILLLLVSLFIASRGLFKGKLVNTQLASIRQSAFWLTFNFSNIFDPIREALRRGILHPKLYE